jgi:FMN phosphatase YigB (HAD superfamily)
MMIAGMPSIYATQPIFNPQNTLIAFDVDGVLGVGRSENAQEWIKHHHALAVACGDIKKRYGLKDAVLILNQLIQDYPELNEDAEVYKEVLSTMTPFPQVNGIVDTLNSAGYAVIAATNMTEGSYKGLARKQYLSAAFSAEKFFTQTNPLNLKPITEDKAGEPYYAKPHEVYFKNLICYCNEQFKDAFPAGIQHIIFIDDTLKNVEGAQNIALFTALHFTDAQQLKADLSTLLAITF